MKRLLVHEQVVHRREEASQAQQDRFFITPSLKNPVTPAFIYRQKALTLAGVLLAMFLGSLNQTIISTALPSTTSRPCC